MKPTTPRRSGNKQRLFYLLAGLIVVGAIIYWASNLAVDPPMYYSGIGQSLSTDPAQYVYHARNKVLFGQFDPFSYPRWTVYQHSLVSLVAYFWFSIAGVSLAKANAVGVMLNLGALILILVAIGRNHKPWVMAAVAFCYVIDITLLTYGRLSYLENGLAFLAALTFLVYSWWGNRLWGVMLAGAVVAFATLTGKLFGALLLPALLMTILLSGNESRWKFLFSSVGAYLMSALALAFILYGSDFQATLGYFTEQSYGLRGFPEGLSSPLAFFEHLISYGFTNRLYYKSPDLYLMVGVALVLLAVFLSSGKKFRGLSRSTQFGVFWVGFSMLGLMPLNYSPLRYALLFIPGIIVTTFVLIDDLREHPPIISNSRRWTSLVILLFAFWFGLYHLFTNILYFNLQPSPVRMMTWTSCLGAIVLTAAVWYFVWGKQFLRLSRGLFVGLIVLLVVASAVVNGFRIRRHQFMERNYTILESSNEIQQLLGPGAVVSGPYAAVLTVNNHVKSFIHLFGVAQVDSTLFQRFPITHLAVDEDNWREAVRQYPQLKNLTPITVFWVRDVDVNLYDISRLFGNPVAAGYQKSLYEKSVEFLMKQQTDSAVVALNNFLKLYPNQKSAGLLLANLYQMAGQNDRALALLVPLARIYSTDFYVQLQTARMMQEIAIQKKDNYMLGQAQLLYAHAVEVNRYRADLANNLYEQTMKQMQVGGGTPSR